ncbi:MAG: hypothetical protein QM503_10900 [Bacteroidota bacterium]
MTRTSICTCKEGIKLTKDVGTRYLPAKAWFQLTYDPMNLQIISSL